MARSSFDVLLSNVTSLTAPALRELETSLAASVKELSAVDSDEALAELEVAVTALDKVRAALEAASPAAEDAVAAAAPAKRPAAPGAAKANRPPTAAHVPPSSPATPAVSPAGIQFAGRREIAEAFINTAREFAHSQGDRSSVVASFKGEAPDARVLGGDADRNAELLNAFIGLEAVTAAGGLCAPTAPIYDTQMIASAARPLRDSLVQFGANRGGVQFIEPPHLADVADGIRVTTEAQDATVGYYDSNPKPCTIITCGQAIEVTVAAISRCLEVGNFRNMSHPEAVTASLGLLIAAHARLAENTLWNSMASLSTATSAGQVLGTFRDVMASIVRGASAFRSRNRTDLETPLHLWAPGWLRDEMQVDLVRQLPGDDVYSRARQIIAQAFASINVNPTWALEGGGQEFGPQGVGPLTGWPTTTEVILSHEGGFIFLDGGTLDLGLQRDSVLNQSNNLQIWAETFENVAFLGVESLAISLDLCPSGESSAAADASGVCTAGS